MGNTNIYFRYYRGTDANTRNSLKNTVSDFVKKLDYNKNFLKGFQFYLVKDYKDLPATSEFTKCVKENSDEYKYTGGMTIPMICNNNKKEIVINAANQGISSIWNSNKSAEQIAQATMHEIGHQFDDQFGSCDAALLEKAKTLPFETTTKEQDKILIEYQSQKDLSDTKEFKKAWQKDAEELGKDTLSNYWFKQRHLDFYVWDVDITDGVTSQEVDEADYSRSEIFAQLFSYAMGTDDGQKDAIVKKYPNSYKVVKQFIKTHLNINVN